MNRKKTHLKCAVGFLRPETGGGFLLSAFAASLLIASLASPVHALPQGGQVAGGQAVITNPDGSSMRVDQSSQRAIINWQSYNIGANERVHYQQPSASSVSLNRINPQSGVSRIYGNLSSNGQVWLLNPAGIWFGPTARVDVAGILATTAGISDQHFMAGQYRFAQDPNWNGSIINEGVIVVHNAGLAAFVSPGVVNNGKIMATLGTVVLASGTEFTIDFNGDQSIQFVVSGKVTDYAVDQNGNRLSSAVKNSGMISANGGRVIMTAQGAGKVLDNAINMSGYVEAKSVGVKKW